LGDVATDVSDNYSFDLKFKGLGPLASSIQN